MSYRYTKSTWATYSLLRFFLASIVFIGHLGWFADPIRLSKLFNLFGGKSAVIGFLLISGISVGHSFKMNPNDYFERRFLRIYPLYFFGVLFAALLMVLLPSPYKLPNLTLVASGWETTVSNFFFAQGFLSATISYNNPLWTLSIEVFLYLLTPLLARLPSKVIVLLIVGSMLAFTFPNFNLDLYGYGVALFAWPWLIGFLLSVKNKPTMAAILSLIGIPIVFYGQITHESLSWLTYTLTIVIVYYAGKLFLADWLRKIANFFGEISYPLYVLHLPTAIFFFYIAGKQSMWVYIGFVLFVTVILYYVLDRWLKTIFWKPLVRSFKSSFPKGNLIGQNN